MFDRLIARLRGWLAGGTGDDSAETDTDGDGDDGVDGSGDAYRDPAYNGRYEAEREVDRIAAAAEEIEDRDARDR